MKALVLDKLACTGLAFLIVLVAVSTGVLFMIYPIAGLLVALAFVVHALLKTVSGLKRRPYNACSLNIIREYEAQDSPDALSILCDLDEFRILFRGMKAKPERGRIICLPPPALWEMRMPEWAARRQALMRRCLKGYEVEWEDYQPQDMTSGKSSTQQDAIHAAAPSIQIERENWKSCYLNYEEAGYCLRIYMEISGVKDFNLVGSSASLEQWNHPPAERLTLVRQEEIFANLLHWCRTKKKRLSFGPPISRQEEIWDYERRGYTVTHLPDGSTMFSPSKQ